MPDSLKFVLVIRDHHLFSRAQIFKNQFAKMRMSGKNDFHFLLLKEGL